MSGRCSPNLIRWVPPRGIAALAAAAVLAACNDPPPVEPPPEVVYQTQHFVIRDAGALSAATVDSLEARLELEYGRVAAALPALTPPEQLTVLIQPGEGIPFVTPGNGSLTQWAASLALDYLPHQLTHLFTGYQRGGFLEEGLAVYVTELLLPDVVTVNPYRGQPPHAWLTLFEQFGSTISLFTAYRAANFSYSFSGSSADASAWQVHIEGGSFTRWVVDTYGWDKWWELYALDDLGLALGGSTPDIETAWLAAAESAFPDPITCETALGAVGPREEFWCRRTRGE
jgi:hypothetical protein